MKLDDSRPLRETILAMLAGLAFYGLTGCGECHRVDSGPDADPDVDSTPDTDADQGADTDGEVDASADTDSDTDADAVELPRCTDSSVLEDIARESVTMLLLLTDPDTLMTHDGLAIRGDDGCPVSPGFWVMSQAPHFDLRGVWYGGGGTIAASWAPGCPSCIVTIRLGLRLPEAGAYAGIALPLGGVAPRGTTIRAVDLHRYDRMRIRWCVEPGAVALREIDVKLQYVSADGSSRDEAAIALPLTSSSLGCEAHEAYTTTDIPLSSFGDEERLSRVSQIVIGANGGQLREVDVHIDRIWFYIDDAETRAETDFTCPTDDYPDLVCGASLTGSDKVALSLMSFAAAADLGLMERSLAVDIIARAIATLERLPRWTGLPGEVLGLRAGEEFSPVPGLPPNWFDPVSLIQNPRDRVISLMDVADEIAVMLSLHALLEEWGEDDLAHRAEELGHGAWAALGRLTERGRETYGDRAIYGAVLPARDMIHPDTTPGVLEWRHVVRLNDTTLASALCVGSGACSRDDWDSRLVAACTPGGSPTCPEPCDDWHETRDGCGPRGLCFWQAEDGTTHEWMPTCFHGGDPSACPVVGDPPYTAAGGLFLAFKSSLFLYPDDHPVSARRALPTPLISVGESARASARAQLAFARERGLRAGGASNCNNPRSCTERGYLGGRCLEPGIVTPHALLLALSADPEAACEALRFLTEETPLGDDVCPLEVPGVWSRSDVGPRDAIDLSAWRPGMTCAEARSAGVIRDAWLSLDIALGFLSYYNYCTGGRLREFFERGGGRRVYEGLERVP